MVSRALIIAIEEYPDLDQPGIEKTLPDTLSDALKFKEWLEAKWTAEGRDETERELIFCSEPKQGFGTGASVTDVKGALLDLEKRGRNMTDELYFYFNGHGYAFADGYNRADVVICSDFKNADLSSESCLSLDWIIFWLREHLGAGNHFYFVDACRNNLDSEQVAPPGKPLKYKSKATGQPTSYVLQSAARNSGAVVGGPFQESLLSGLKGDGYAKTWSKTDSGAMYVRYDSLRDYLNEKLKRKENIPFNVKGPDGPSEGVLNRLQPVPLQKCTIEISPSNGPEEGTIVARGDRSKKKKQKKFKELPAMLELEPDRYNVSLQFDGGSGDAFEPLNVDLFEDKKLRFERPPEDLSDYGDYDDYVYSERGGLGGSGGLPGDSIRYEIGVPPDMPRVRRRRKKTRKGKHQGLTLRSVAVTLPPNTTADVQRKKTGVVKTLSASRNFDLPTGDYVAAIRSPNGDVIANQSFRITANSKARLDLRGWGKSAPHNAIASHFPNDGATVEFSESLGGWVDDMELDLWLAVIGAGRILSEAPGHFSKISPLPLREFWNEKPDSTSVYVLAGFEDPETDLAVGIGKPKKPRWKAAVEPAGMPGIRESFLRAKPGQQLVSLMVGDRAPYSVASCTMKNRSTLITVTEEQGALRISQFILPVGCLRNHLPVQVRKRIGWRNQLHDVLQVARLHGAFRARRNAFEEILAPTNLLDELLYTKWVDPIGATLASYELMRRQKMKMMKQVVKNMKMFFPELPDVAALQRLASGKKKPGPSGVPLFLDGLRAFPDQDDWLPLPSSHLDYSSPWTAWRAAVKA